MNVSTSPALQNVGHKKGTSFGGTADVYIMLSWDAQTDDHVIMDIISYTLQGLSSTKYPAIPKKYDLTELEVWASLRTRTSTFVVFIHGDSCRTR